MVQRLRIIKCCEIIAISVIIVAYNYTLRKLIIEIQSQEKLHKLYTFNYDNFSDGKKIKIKT